MLRERLKRFGIVLAAWLPFFLIWVLYAMSLAHYRLAPALLAGLISMGSASLLGVWHLCQRWPGPLRLDLKFYLLQGAWAALYSTIWTASVNVLECIRHGGNPLAFWKSPLVPWQLVTGVWLYGLFAGVSYALQLRNRLHEKETLALRAEALAAAARLDAVRARLNPHSLFNALHTLSALVKFRPAMAEEAIERLGDMLRYTLKEDGRELVEFSEEFEFTKQYLSFEQLRFEDRLKVDLQIEPESFNFDLPPFSMQTLAENAVRHAISIRPEGGSIWIKSRCRDDGLILTNRRTGEVGIRMALGVARRRIARMILRETLLLVFCGLALGLPGAAFASRLVASQLFGLKAWDRDTFLAACAVMAAVATTASYLPAQRAASIDPMQALRTE